MQPANYESREFPMTDENFVAIQKQAYASTGIKLTVHKKEMIYSRISRRIRQLGLKTFNEYCELIARDDHPEHNEFVNTITTNLTSFYREPHHFDYLKKTVMPWLLSKHQRDHRVRIWSSGCSSGEEPYTIAATFLQNTQFRNWDVKILATDLDSDTLDKGRRGLYSGDKLDNLTPEQHVSLFSGGSDEKNLNIKPQLKELIHFKRLNLMETPWPMSGPFDIIFCRNVVIYFDKDTQKSLFDRYANLLVPDGYLFIGHSESLNGVSNRFRLLGKTIYQRTH